ncbi:LOW QUALITY PROTEIN: Aspartic peptidase domain containing protein [Trema orientale]|uniref:Aspartic peptidase domain containing protein n=1 Tax=Trema orientale TaxID=63057 RepID=A0A2P5D9U7_TREOI|nr:LOW QUALITY PROTEIN: Aspartic peptidase domain containing protein [Trema orientale]
MRMLLLLLRKIHKLRVIATTNHCMLKPKSMGFKRAIVDNGSSVNLMSWQTFKDDKKLVVQVTPIVTFASSSYVTKGYVNVDLQVGQIRTPTKFHVIDVDVSYHLLLGRL